MGERDIGGSITLLGGQPGEFIQNESLLIVLIGNGTASAAEATVDLLHNVSNVPRRSNRGDGYRGRSFGKYLENLLEWPRMRDACAVKFGVVSYLKFGYNIIVRRSR